MNGKYGWIAFFAGLACGVLGMALRDLARKDQAPEAYLPVMGDYTEIQTSCPEVSGLCFNPSGKGLLAASDENGVYQVDWDGQTRPFYVTEGWTDCEGVTLDPATGDVYYIVEGKQEVYRLRAPRYREAELVCVIDDVGLGTNLGLEGITWYKDNTLLIGNQGQPIRLVRYSLTEGRLSHIDLSNTSEIADLCYDPVRDVLWIADSNRHALCLCDLDGTVKATYPVPFIENGEGLCVDRQGGCIWVGDDTSSKIYKISFSGL